MYFITYQYREHERATWQEVVETYRMFVATEAKQARKYPDSHLGYPMVTSEHRDDERDGLTDAEREELDDIFSDTTRSDT